MEKRAAVLALALTFPLVLYGVPYAYAIATQSTYVVEKFQQIPKDTVYPSVVVDVVMCSTSSDFTQHFTTIHGPDVSIVDTVLLNSGQLYATTGDNPNGWRIDARNPNPSFDEALDVQIICQSAITVPAGIGVPQFGSLYVAIALGAALYFMLSRRFSGGPQRAAQA